jgi:hypothetical protein
MGKGLALLQASFGSPRASGSLRRGIVQVVAAGVGCNARRAEPTSCYNQQYLGSPSNDTIASLGAFVRLEPYTLKGVRTVLRRPGGRETT